MGIIRRMEIRRASINNLMRIEREGREMGRKINITRIIIKAISMGRITLRI